MSEISHPRAIPFVGIARLLALLLPPILLAAAPAHAQLRGNLDSDTRPTVLDLTRLIGHLIGTAVTNNRLTGVSDMARYGNAPTKDTAGLEAPLKFECGVDGEMRVDGWKTERKQKP